MLGILENSTGKPIAHLVRKFIFPVVLRIRGNTGDQE